MTDWAREYFEIGYGQRWTLGPPSAETQREADALWALLGLTPGARLLDVGCGHGRLAVALARRGARVTGVDFAAPLLARAGELAESMQVAPRWVRGDMRSLPVRPASVAGAVLFDAIGFFDEEEANRAVLRELARALAPGGRAGVRVVNAAPILADFRAMDLEQRGDTAVAIDRALRTDPPRLIEDITVTGPRGTGRYQRRQRLYRAEELAAAMEEAGLGTVAVLASAAGAPFDAARSPSMVVVGERRRATPA